MSRSACSALATRVGFHDAFTSRHRRLRITDAKRWGVALIPIPDTFEAYISGSPRKLLRQKRRLAEKAGFRQHAIVSPADHLDENSPR